MGKAQVRRRPAERPARPDSQKPDTARTQRPRPDDRPRPETRRRRRSKRAIRRARRRLAILVLIVIIAIVVAVVVSTLIRNGVFEPIPDKTLMKVSSDGSIVYEEVTVLSDEYDIGQVGDFAREQVDSYTPKEGDQVVLERVKSSGDTAYVRMKYSSARAYSEFTGYEAYFGTVSGALASGHNFETGFKSASGEEVSRDTVLENGGARVFILQENTTVKVDGDILYVSSEGTNVSDGEVEIYPVDGNLDAPPVCYIVFSESKETE